MGIYDRDYIFRNSPGRRTSLSSFNMMVIVVNVAVFLLGAVSPKIHTAMLDYGFFSTFKVSPQGGLQFWRFITYQFLHSGPSHVLFNMLGLFVFGPLVEQHLGSKRYLALYLTCGICGGLSYLLLNAMGIGAAMMGYTNLPIILYSQGGSFAAMANTPLIGASAGVFGVIVAAAVIAPNLTVQLLFPPVPMRLKILAMVYVGLAALNLVFGGHNAGGDAAHLGGAIGGYVLIRRAYLLRDFFDVFSDSRKKPKKMSKSTPAPIDSPRARSRRDEDAEVDRILDKVREKGTASLTNDEKETLARATRSRGGA